MLPNKIWSDELASACSNYFALSVYSIGKQDIAFAKQLKYFAHLERHFFSKDRALQDFDFPIASVNGTRDFLGSKCGTDKIVQNNRYFKTGQSQIFKLRNAGHNVFLDNPDELVEMMIGFFEGTIKHTFDLTTTEEWSPDTNE